MKTTNQIIQEIQERIARVQDQLDLHNGNETYTQQLDAVDCELQDLLSWIKE